MNAMRYVAVSLIWILLVGCATKQSISKDLSENAAEAKAGVTEIYMFNVSRWVLFPRTLDVTDNGWFVFSMPRKSYKKLYISPGVHILGCSYSKQRSWETTTETEGSLSLNVTEGKKYFVTVDYDPTRGAWPLAFLDKDKRHMIIKEINEEEAQPLLKSYSPL